MNKVIRMPMEDPILPVPEEYRLLSAQSVRLDTTAIDEQLLFLQTKDNLSLPIKIRLINFDQSRRTSYVSWEGSVLACANEPFTYDFQDVLGTRQKQILVRGLDELGRPTLDILSQVNLPGGRGIQLRKVFSLALKGTINIVQSPRSASYDSGESDDVSFPIVTEQTDLSNPKATGILKTTYEFRPTTDEYVKAKDEVISEIGQNDTVMQKLFAGNTQEFVDFLKGPWLKTDTIDLGLHPMLFFDPSAKELTFATDSAQEVYQWEVLSRTMQNGLYIVGNNELIGLISVQLSLTVTSSDSIDVNVLGTPSWSGTYRRLPRSLLFEAQKTRADALAQVPAPLGIFHDEKGAEIQFSPPLVTWITGNKKRVYASSLFRLNGHEFIQLELIQTPSTPHAEAQTFLFDETVTKSSSRVIQNITLQPGRLSVAGWKSDRREPLRMEQFELASESSKNSLP